MEIAKHLCNMHGRKAALSAGGVWLAWGLVAGLLPLWGTSILLLLFGKGVKIYELLRNGEFVLYAASFIGGSLFTIRRDIFPSKNLLNLSLIATLMASTLIFAAITVASMSQAPGPNPLAFRVDESTLTALSIFIFAVATFLSWLITVVDASGGGRDVATEIRNGERALEDAFERAAAKSGISVGGNHGSD